MTITTKYAVLINFTPALHPEKETCSIDILNPWIDENQNGFGIFPTRPIDCSLVINIECLPNGTSLQQVTCSLRYSSFVKITISFRLVHRLCNTLVIQKHIKSKCRAI